MCSLLACAYYFLVIHLIIRFYLITTITTTSFGLSLDTSTVGFSCDYIKMPVLTRSMMKRGLQPPPGSVGILTCPTCYTDGNINSSSPTDFPQKNIIFIFCSWVNWWIRHIIVIVWIRWFIRGIGRWRFQNFKFWKFKIVWAFVACSFLS